MGDRQVRTAHTVIVGWDMTTALALGRALGIPEILIADVLPPVEAVAMAAMRERLKPDG